MKFSCRFSAAINKRSYSRTGGLLSRTLNLGQVPFGTLQDQDQEFSNFKP
jgi:hypothetical protein